MNIESCQRGIHTFHQCSEIQLLQGVLGCLNVVDQANQKVRKGSAIILNNNTVLTISQNVFNSSSLNFFPQIEFIIASGNSISTYPVVEAILLSPTDKGQKDANITGYAILKLGKTIMNTVSLLQLFGTQDSRKIDHNIHKSKIELKCSTLEEQLKKANTNISELSSELNKLFQQLKDAKQYLYSFGNLQQLRGSSFDIFLQCLRIDQSLYGEDSLQVIGILAKLAQTSEKYYQDSEQAKRYYRQIIKICEKHQAFGNQEYIGALYSLGCHCCIDQQDTEAIHSLEQILHLSAQISADFQRDCALRLVKLLQRYDMWQAVAMMKERYGL